MGSVIVLEDVPSVAVKMIVLYPGSANCHSTVVSVVVLSAVPSPSKSQMYSTVPAASEDAARNVATTGVRMPSAE